MDVKNIVGANLVKNDLRGHIKNQVLAELGQLFEVNDNVTNAQAFI